MGMMTCESITPCCYNFQLVKVVAAWEEKGNNRRIANMDGEDLVPDRMVGGLVQEMSGDIMVNVPGEITS